MLRLGIPTSDGLGLFYSDFLESQSQASEKQVLKEIDARLDQQVVRQKNPAAQQQQQVKQITGSVPIRELLGDEDKLLHLAMQEDAQNSYREFGADGSTITHTAYLPFPCKNPHCGICNNAASDKEAESTAEGCKSSCRAQDFKQARIEKSMTLAIIYFTKINEDSTSHQTSTDIIGRSGFSLIFY